MIDYNQLIEAHIGVFQLLKKIEENVLHCSNELVKCLKNNGKIMVCGNGGSAADAQHFAAELTGHYYKERRPLAAIALTTDTSALTAIGNDYSYDDVFSRQLKALGRAEDVLIAISTSGNSRNVIEAVKVAQKMGMKVICLTGESGGNLKACVTDANGLLRVPSSITSRAQEAHIFILHYFCEHIDQVFE